MASRLMLAAVVGNREKEKKGALSETKQRPQSSTYTYTDRQKVHRRSGERSAIISFHTFINHKLQVGASEEMVTHGKRKDFLGGNFSSLFLGDT